MNKVEKLFKNKAIIRAKTMYFSKNNALLFIKECEKNKIQILGIDAFYLPKEAIQPSLDNSIDFSKNHKEKIENIHSKAINFLKEKDDKLYFEIVCK